MTWRATFREGQLAWQQVDGPTYDRRVAVKVEPTRSWGRPRAVSLIAANPVAFVTPIGEEQEKRKKIKRH